MTSNDTVIHHCRGRTDDPKWHLNNNNFKNNTFTLNHHITALDRAQNVKAPLPQSHKFLQDKSATGKCASTLEESTSWSTQTHKTQILSSLGHLFNAAHRKLREQDIVRTRLLHLGPKSHEIVLDYHRLLTPGQQSGWEERSSSALMHVLWVQTGRKKKTWLSTITKNLAASLISSTKPSPHAKAAGWRKCLWERTRSISSSKPCTLWCDRRKWLSHRKWLFFFSKKRFLF